MSEELTLLKERANQLGLKYSPNIGVEALRAKVAAALAGDGEPEEAADAALVGALVETEAQRDARIRNEQHAEHLALVRIRISCMNPLKAAVPGEFITVGNAYIGTHTKYVPFGEATDNGYHVPKIIYEELRARKFNQTKTQKLPGGGVEVHQRMVPEFSIEVLEPLTPEELGKLAAAQAAAAGL